jgi:ribose transport system ATP-binding protein
MDKRESSFPEADAPSALRHWETRVRESADEPSALRADAARGTIPLLAFEGIGKSFGGVRVLNAIGFAVPRGSTLGLVGENGAGKSTLMNILGGNLTPDTGRMWWNGQPYAPRHPGDAAQVGIGFIHQELNLFANLSIAENLFLTSFPRLGALPWIDRRRLREASVALLEQVGLNLPPETPLERLSAGERQLVEIAKALSREAQLLIFDEPTTSLSTRETQQLFQLLARLRARGLAMIYISHTLEDVLRLADELVVLRDGEIVGFAPAKQLTPERLVALMVGRQLPQLYPARPAVRSVASTASTPQTPVFETRALGQPGVIRDIAFQIQAGELVGVAGLMGAGRSELARILFGLDSAVTGEIRICGSPLNGTSPRQRIRRGLAFLTEDRRAEGLCLEASIADNITLASLPRQARPISGWLRLPALREAVRVMRAAVKLTPTARDEQPVQTLSGGNQQKAVLAKWLLVKPRVLILDEPTRGIDVGARQEIYQLMRELADGGAGVLIISSEIEELLGLCDRILVMRRGEIVETLTREAFDRERILRAALHVPHDSRTAGLQTGPVDPPAGFPANPLPTLDPPSPHITHILPAMGRRESTGRRSLLLALNSAPYLLFAAVLITFGLLSPRFLTGEALLNIAIQSSATAMIAIGMTLVLLTAGVDLSVGAIMYVAAAVGGKLVLGGTGLLGVLLTMVGVGFALGLLNAFLVTRLGIIAFIATLGTQYLGRGFGLRLTETRAMNLPDQFLALATTRFVGVPLPVWVLLAVVLVVHLLLTRSPFGRQLYAVGQDAQAARKAGIDVRRILGAVYILCGVSAALGSVFSLAQLGAVAPTFGLNKEFGAIAAAVLGGTSLFGGRGHVFPGTVLGALLIQSVENGLTVVNANVYLYPLITSLIIFIAVLLDSFRNHCLARLRRRRIRSD